MPGTDASSSPAAESSGIRWKSAGSDALASDHGPPSDAARNHRPAASRYHRSPKPSYTRSLSVLVTSIRRVDGISSSSGWPSVTMSSVGVVVTCTSGTLAAGVPGIAASTSVQLSSRGRRESSAGRRFAPVHGPRSRSVVVSHESPTSR